MSRFTGLPDIPQSGVDPWMMEFLGAVKQNIELLTGARGETDLASKAIVRSTITVSQISAPSLQAITSRGSGYTIAGVQVPSYIDYANLLQDFRRLANDVADLRAIVNVLIAQLRGS